MLDYLPHDILLEVLFRIPVKFLVRCTAVCKSWNSLINSPDFIYAHLQSSMSRNTTDSRLIRVLLCEGNIIRSSVINSPDFISGHPWLLSEENGGYGYALHFESIECDEYFHEKVDFPRILEDLLVIGYSNGLMCFAHYGYEVGYYRYLLWNPTIQKIFTLPQSNYEYHLIAAFEFDSTVNDFKVFGADSKYESTGKLTIEAELYSLRKNSWKIVNVRDPNFHFCNIFRYSFVKGMMHFLGYEYDEENLTKYLILGFDMASEVFDKIMLPESLQSANFLYPTQYGESSIAVVGDRGNDLEMWIMEEYGELGSWRKVLDMSNDERLLQWIFGVWKGREVLLKNVDGRVTSLNLNCQQRKDLGLTGGGVGSHSYSSLRHYEESLALLDKGKDTSVLDNVLYGGDSSG